MVILVDLILCLFFNYKYKSVQCGLVDSWTRKSYVACCLLLEGVGGSWTSSVLTVDPYTNSLEL